MLKYFQGPPSPPAKPDTSLKTQISEAAAEVLYNTTRLVKSLPAFRLLSCVDQEQLYLSSWLPLFLTGCSSRLSLREVEVVASQSSLPSSLLSLLLTSVKVLQTPGLTALQSSYLRNALIFLPRPPLVSSKLEASKQTVEVMGQHALSAAQLAIGPLRLAEILQTLNTLAASISADFVHKLFFKDVIEDVNMDLIVMDILKTIR